MKEFEMTEKQAVLFSKLTTIQQDVALATLRGLPPIEAYNTSKGKASTNGSKSASVSRILKDVNVMIFMAEMRIKEIREAVMGREEMLEELTTMIRTNLPLNAQGEIDLSSLTEDQRSSIEMVQHSEQGVKVKMHPKLQAMKQLADMQGYNEPVQVDQKTTFKIDGTDPKAASQAYADMVKNV